MVLNRLANVVALCVCFVMFAAAVSSAGVFYQSDEQGYWWYVDGSPEYEVLVPSNAYAYPQLDFGGATTLHLALDESGPMFLIGSLPGTDPKASFQSLTRSFTVGLTSTRTTEDSEITTNQGLKPRFMVLSGPGQDNKRGLIRMVAFTKGDRTAFLMFVGDESDFVGDIRQHWLKAVHSFRWL